MKRLSKEKILRLDRLRKKRLRNTLRRKHYHYAPDYRFKVTFPSVMSLDRNYLETISAIEEIKRHGHSPARKPVVIEVDFSRVVSVSTASMLILNSEIDRILTRRWHSVRFVAILMGSWDAKVVRQLERHGFFDLLDIDLKVDWPEELEGTRHTLLPMIACHRMMPERVQRMRRRLEDIAKYFHHGPQLYEAMVEATGNAVLHAYKLPDQLRYPPAAEGSWWATAEYSEDDGLVRVVVFDQGAGIAATLPRWDHWEKVRGVLSLLSGEDGILNDDAHMIEAALQVSRTSMTSGHGQGLQDVLAPVSETGKGFVRILSGRGSILYDAKNGAVRKSLPSHVGGTLIEWSLPTFSDEQDQSHE